VRSRDDALALDASDPLAHCRARFHLPVGVVYLDGNSLGALPVGVAARLDEVVEQEWGVDLIRSWNANGWWEAPRRVGDRLGGLVGAAAGQVVVGDSTSVNVAKLLTAALRMRPGRPVIVTEAGNFPTDLYIAAEVARTHGATIRFADPARVQDALTDDVAVLLLTHVDYRSGRMHDLAGLTAAAHAVGALVLWDLAHSAGAVPLDLDGDRVDLAVGCGYKYLNGGPGAPAWLYVAERHQPHLDQPLPGWHGHARPFAMEAEYEPAAGVTRALTGTPPLLSMAALEAALHAFDGVTMLELRAKSLALTDAFIALVDERLAGHGFQVATPRAHALRGSQVSLAHPDAYPLVQALIARGVIGDFREPDLLRFGFAPLYIRFADVWDAVEQLLDVVTTGEWDDPRFTLRSTVT
jgi:kynureninase